MFIETIDNRNKKEFMMQFIVFGKLPDEYNGKPVVGLQEVLEGEWAKSREWYKKGHLRQSWLYENNRESFGLFEVKSRKKMDELIADYPGIKEGFVTADVRVIEPYTGVFFGPIRLVDAVLFTGEQTQPPAPPVHILKAYKQWFVQFQWQF